MDNIVNIELSVPPHYKDTEYETRRGKLHRKEGTPPPAVVFSVNFTEVSSAISFLNKLGIKVDSDEAIKTVLAAEDQYVAEELEVLDFETGTIYIEASLAIEGQFVSKGM